MSLCTVARYFYSSPKCGNTPDRRSSHFLQASRWPGRNRRCCRRSRPDRERGVMAAPVVIARGTKSIASTAGLAAAGEAVGCRDRGSLARHGGDHVAPKPRPLWAERRRPDSMPGRHRVDRDRCAQIFLYQDTDGDAGHSARGAACRVRAASQSQRPLPRHDNKRRGWVSWTCPLEVILFWKLRADIRCQPNDGYRIGQIFL